MNEESVVCGAEVDCLDPTEAPETSGGNNESQLTLESLWKKLVEHRREVSLGAVASGVALAASGTVALELAMARVPMVIGYKLNGLTAMIVRRLVRIGARTLKEAEVGDLVIAVAIGIVLGGRFGYILFYQPGLLVRFVPEPPYWGLLAINENPELFMPISYEELIANPKPMLHRIFKFLNLRTDPVALKYAVSELVEKPIRQKIEIHPMLKEALSETAVKLGYGVQYSETMVTE